MKDPWETPLDRDDYRAAAIVLSACGRASGRLTVDAMQAIERGAWNAIPATTVTPYGAFSITPRFVMVAVSGTVGLLQWVLQFLGSGQSHYGGIPGNVDNYFAIAAGLIAGRIGSAVIPALAGRRLVLMGHSFGGAIVQILAAQWAGLAGRGCTMITFGCPRVGDAEFADAVNPFLTRIENTQDPICVVPPVVWAGFGSPWSWPFGLQPAFYQHAGAAITLTNDGELQPGEQQVSLSNAWTQLQAQSAPTHEIDEYLRRIQLVQDVPQVDWADPPELDAVGEFLAPAGAIGGGPMAVTQGLIYINTTEEVAGWTEGWFKDTTPAAMLTDMNALLTARAAFLASTCKIVAVRTSNVDPTAPRLSLLRRLPTPITGAFDAGSIKNRQLKTNETMDSIDYQCKSLTNGSSKLAAFRGIADTLIEGSQLTAEGTAALPIIESYLLAVKTATMGMNVYSRGVGNPIKAIGGLSQDALTKLIVVTATAHGIPAGPPVPVVTIRRVKSNPMLNGKWRVSVTDPNTFVLIGSNKFYVNSTGDGTFQLYSKSVDTLDSYQFDSVSIRKTGAPFGRRRGKRSARLLHH